MSNYDGWEVKARRSAFNAAKFNSDLHPRDRLGRFIETGATVTVWGGGRGTVVKNVGGGRIEVRMANGSVQRVHRNYLTVEKRPDGGKPISKTAEAPRALKVETPSAEAVDFTPPGPDGRIPVKDLQRGQAVIVYGTPEGSDDDVKRYAGVVRSVSPGEGGGWRLVLGGVNPMAQATTIDVDDDDEMARVMPADKVAAVIDAMRNRAPDAAARARALLEDAVAEDEREASWAGLDPDGSWDAWASALNDRFGSTVSGRDLETVYGEAAGNARVRQAAVGNTDMGRFGQVFDEEFLDRVAARPDLFSRGFVDALFARDEAFQNALVRAARERAHTEIRAEKEKTGPTPEPTPGQWITAKAFNDPVRVEQVQETIDGSEVEVTTIRGDRRTVALEALEGWKATSEPAKHRADGAPPPEVSVKPQEGLFADMGTDKHGNRDIFADADEADDTPAPAAPAVPQDERPTPGTSPAPDRDLPEYERVSLLDVQPGDVVRVPNRYGNLLDPVTVVSVSTAGNGEIRGKVDGGRPRKFSIQTRSDAHQLLRLVTPERRRQLTQEAAEQGGVPISGLSVQAGDRISYRTRVEDHFRSMLRGGTPPEIGGAITIRGEVDTATLDRDRRDPSGGRDFHHVTLRPETVTWEGENGESGTTTAFNNLGLGPSSIVIRHTGEPQGRAGAPEAGAAGEQEERQEAPAVETDANGLTYTPVKRTEMAPQIGMQRMARDKLVSRNVLEVRRPGDPKRGDAPLGDVWEHKPKPTRNDPRPKHGWRWSSPEAGLTQVVYPSREAATAALLAHIDSVDRPYPVRTERVSDVRPGDVVLSSHLLTEGVDTRIAVERVERSRSGTWTITGTNQHGKPHVMTPAPQEVQDGVRVVDGERPEVAVQELPAFGIEPGMWVVLKGRTSPAQVLGADLALDGVAVRVRHRDGREEDLRLPMSEPIRRGFPADAVDQWEQDRAARMAAAAGTPGEEVSAQELAPGDVLDTPDGPAVVGRVLRLPEKITVGVVGDDGQQRMLPFGSNDRVTRRRPPGGVPQPEEIRQDGGAQDRDASRSGDEPTQIDTNGDDRVTVGSTIGAPKTGPAPDDERGSDESVRRDGPQALADVPAGGPGGAGGPGDVLRPARGAGQRADRGPGRGDRREGTAGETFLEKLGRLNAARAQAREIVLAEQVFLPAEPGLEDAELPTQQ
ncbi:hypothetical protein [Planomonospora algeriensis]